MNAYLDFVKTPIPQTESLNEKQVKNNAGGFVYQISELQYLQRFLILGTEGGTYYQSERDLTKENVANIIKCLKDHPKESLDLIVDVSNRGRAPKNSPAIFALALACKHSASSEAYDAIVKVCRIGTHLFEFCSYIQALEKGWSGGLRRGVSNFYQRHNLAVQLIKYRQRKGWTHKDVLRLCHASSLENNQLLRWAVGKLDLPEDRLVEGFIKIQEMVKEEGKEKVGKGKVGKEKEAVKLIEEYELPWEAVPTQFLKSKDVWESILPHLPYTATLRNLGRLSSIGLLSKEFNQHTDLVIDRLKNPESIKKSRVHPISILMAKGIYEMGCGDKGDLTWSPVSRVVEALEEAFYLSFDNYEPTGKRMLLALDISGSMGTLMNCGISCCCAATALAMLYLKKEPKVVIRGFADTFRDLGITRNDSITQAISKTSRQNFGSTNCSLPMQWALDSEEEVDIFVVFTDSETYTGNIHPSEALKKYRKKMNINAKLAVFGMTSTGFSIADPEDPGMIDLVGFDASAPVVLHSFLNEFSK